LNNKSKRLLKHATENQIKYSRKVLEAIVKVLDEDLEESYKRSDSLESYELPAWKEFQADQIGTRRTLNKIKSIIKYWE